ncbi:hypothetical protein IWW40_005186 [Coemansia sp. RSA 1250]|nr:hypothetical protein IWW40_005186 [Coemansia sp. RSA 1250]
MYEKLQQNAQQNGFVVQYDETCLERKELATTGLVPFTIVRGTLDNSIPQTVLDNAPYDTVITSFSLCTAEDPATSLKNIVRLLKPGGTYIFIEHILHPPEDEPLLVDGKNVNAKFWRRMQKIANPLWRICGHGCEIIRETAKAIDNTPGWETVSYRYARISDNFLSYFVPMVFGKAIKR